jgi:anti-sigma regulatory factor (Ser/Thr protein kinase)
MCAITQAPPERTTPARTSGLALAALAEAPGCARGHTVNVLREWGMSGLAEDAEMIVSELVTNAVRVARNSGRCPVVSFRLTLQGSRVLIEVSDPSPAPPVRGGAAPDAENGRGLQIVDALAAEWGWRPLDVGKVVWAALSV